jgi:assimilatory nitrate reductase catalytic subunit
VIARPAADGSVSISGDPDHPANRGRLCSKGSALGETLALESRLIEPSIHGVRAGWDEALDLVAGRFSETIEAHGPDSVALYVSGQLLTEDYYAANKLMKGYIGSANIDTNSRLCMASSVAGHKRAFGTDTVPGCYEDLEQADLVVLVGSNLAWCHPILFQRLVAAREQHGTKVVVIDPRRTATCEIADMHLAIAPDTDVALFNGLLVRLAGGDAMSSYYAASHTSGFRDALEAAGRMPLAGIARITGLSHPALREFYDLFQRTRRVVTVYSQGVNQSSAGSDKVNAIINCHLVTGRIGRPGMGPFSVTGQPNAMGGREVGGLANMLAAHMELADAGHRRIVQEFWKSPRIASRPGHKAVEMFDAVGDGRIKALWIMATNPVVSLPEANRVRDALRACPFVVVSDVERHTDTTALAHVLLPSSAWGEKDGTVTNSERCISRQRPFLSPPSEARHDWWQIAQVARRMGYRDGFSWSNPGEIFAEYAALTGAGNAGTRDLDIAAHGAITAEQYEALAPFQWPQPPGEAARQTRFFADGGFFSADGRARFVPTPYRPPATTVSASYPLVLNTGRIRDQWHTMTRTGKTARLLNHMAEPFVEVSPVDASRLGLQAAGLAKLASAHGEVVMRVLVTERVKPGSVFTPIHWNDQLASSARIDALVGAHVDPVSGQPALKYTAVDATPFPARWFAFAIGRSRPCADGLGYWALSRAKAGWRAELADLAAAPDGSALVERLWPGTAARAEVLAYHDSARGEARLAVFEGDILAAALFVAPQPVICARAFIAEQIGQRFEDAASRYRVLAGRPGGEVRDTGPIVCACFEVGRNQILDAVRSGRAATVEAVGRVTRAGTNCGSCRAEIGGLIDAARLAQAG